MFDEDTSTNKPALRDFYRGFGSRHPSASPTPTTQGSVVLTVKVLEQPETVGDGG